MTIDRKAQQQRPEHNDSKRAAQHPDKHQAHEKLLKEVHQLSHDKPKHSGHSDAPAHTSAADLKHPDKRTHSDKAKTSGKHLPQLKIVGFDPGECLTGQASHYGQGDGFFGKERRDGTIHKPGATAAMRLGSAENIYVRVKNLSTGASAQLLVNDYGPGAKTHRIIDINSHMRKTLFNKADIAQVQVCRIK